MIKLLDRYLYGQFFQNFLLVLSALLSIYLLVDFFERVDNFLEAKKTVGLAIRYLLLKIPVMIEQLLPVCILLAGVITLGVLNHHFEFMALKAGGICVTRIIRPLVVACGLSTLLVLAMSQWVLPATVSATNRIWYEQVKNQIPKGIDRDGRTYYRGERGFYSFIRPNPQQYRFEDFNYATWDTQYRLDLLLNARTAVWEDGKWSFADGQVKTVNPDGEYDIKIFKEISLDLEETPENFFLPPYKNEELSLSELFDKARSEEADWRGEYWFEFNKRLSYIFLGFPLLLVGIPVLLIVHRSKGRDLAMAIPISCGMAFVAWGWWSASQSMAKSAYINPAVASWLIHLVAGIIGILMIRRQDA